MSNLVFPTSIKGLGVNLVKTPEFKNKKQDAPNGYSLRISNSANPLWHFHIEFNYLYDQYPSPQNPITFAPHSDLQYLMGFFLAMRADWDDFLLFDERDYAAGGLRGGPWLPGKALPLGYAVVDPAGFAQVVTVGGITSATQRPIFNPSPTSTTTDGSVTWTNMGHYPTGWPNALVELPVVTDGVNFYSPIQRSVAGLYLEDITDLYPGGGADTSTLQVYNGGTLVAAPVIDGPGLATPTAAYQGLYINWGATDPGGPITASFWFYYRVRFEENTQDFERWAQQLWTIGGSQSKNGSGYIKLVTSRDGLV